MQFPIAILYNLTKLVIFAKYKRITTLKIDLL